MDADPSLVARHPRLVAGGKPGAAGAPAPREPRRPGTIGLILLLTLAGGAAVAWGIHQAMAARGTLQITTKPAGATIEIEGMSVRSRYPEDAGWDPDGTEIMWSRPVTVHRQPGTYDVRVTADDYKSRAVQVVLRAGQTTSLEIELTPLTDMRLEISSRPTGRTVSIDGRRVMADPPGHEPAKTHFTVQTIGPGRHSIEISGDCHYQAWTQEIQLQRGVISRVEATLEPWPFKPRGCTDEEWRRED